jgi:hypothetical protein
MIHEHGIQYPINDQWYSEYNNLYKPYLEGNLKLRDFFFPNNEHVIATQKAIHFGLLIALGEWNPMAQMFFNAILLSCLVFIGSLLSSLYLSAGISAVFQAAILVCGLMPGPAENYLFGFQTGWCVYYLASGTMLLCLAKSKKFDFWWALGWAFAIISCLCLASGLANLFLCVAAPVLREWMLRAPIKQILLRSLPFLALCLPFVLLFLKIAIEGRPDLTPSNRPFLSNFIEIFSYPWVILPITYLPTLVAFWLVLARSDSSTRRLTVFPILFALWGLMHALMIGVGRGGFSGRHTELLLIGVLANILLALQLCRSFDLVSRIWIQRMQSIWLAAIFGGLAFQMVDSRKAPQEFAEFMLPRYELLKDSLILQNPDMLSSRNWNTGLPAGLFADRPDLIGDPLVQKIIQTFFPEEIRLSPAPDPQLQLQSMKMFTTPFPFMSWAKLEREQSLDFSAKGIDTPYAKVAIAGRWENPATGIYSKDLGMQKLGLKMPFSQTDGWRAVFLPVRDGMVEFTARVAGDRDWIYIQQPIPVSRWQLGMEFVGRQAWRIWAIYLGLSIFLLVLKCFLAAPFPATPKSEIS